jgi:hypothetical protein
MTPVEEITPPVKPKPAVIVVTAEPLEIAEMRP